MEGVGEGFVVVVVVVSYRTIRNVQAVWLLLLLLLLLLCCNVRSKAASSSFLLPLLPVLATGACGFAVSAPAGSCRHMPFEGDYDNTGLAEAARG